MTKKLTKRWKPTKTKTTAVILAVLFGICSWLYTYKYDAWKFWLNLMLIAMTLGWWALVTLPWVIIDQATKPREFYRDYYKR